MLKLLEKLFPASVRASLQSRAWMFVALAILLAVGVRLRLGDMPLERDEGEYAYAGQLILDGVPPYKEAFNMKLPGTYIAYAASMAVFGHTPAGIHIGLALVNAATIWLMFLLGRKLLDAAAGAVAAVTYALMSLSPDVLGLAGHATHYVMLPAVGGMLLLLKATETRALRFHLLAGMLFGIAFVMKQHGVFFGIFGGLFLMWERCSARILGPGNGGLGSRRAPRLRAGDKIPIVWLAMFKEMGVFSLGCLLPYLGICAWLAAAGVFPQFWFWTVSYGSKYAAGVPLVKAGDVTSAMLKGIIGPNIVFWLLPWVGALMMWWDERLDADRRFWLASLFVFSLVSITVGFYFRQHYFIQLLPVLALLVAVAVSRSLHLLRKDQSVELFLALGIIFVAALATGGVLVSNGAIWFTHSPKKAVEQMYVTTLFDDTREAAKFIHENTKPGARIAVIGSEPQIYFYSGRRSASGHIYTYALMELHPYAKTMQEEMIRQIEETKPEYVVYVQNRYSWLMRNESEKKIFEWWEGYWGRNLDLVKTITTRQDAAELSETNPEAAGQSGNMLLLLKRKDAPGAN
jgi:4-amino-4-deoxy-L-arabinose transferase-like glycosyltransferase